MRLTGVIVMVLASGCGGGVKVPPLPDYSPAESARRALDAYDANKDGKLDVEELRRCPALLKSLESLDKNKDGFVDAKELETRLQQFVDAKVALQTATVRVVRGTQGVEGARITVTPEPFHGDNWKSASGVSDKAGYATLQVDGSDLPGVAAGFYKIAVSLVDSSGKETLASRHNTGTIHGREFSWLRKGPVVVNLEQ